MQLSPSAPRKQTVMVIDNDIDLCELVSMILDNEGLSVISAKGAEEALHMLSEGDIPDLILTDLNMSGMDGGALFSRIRGDFRTKKVPVIIISGAEDLEVRSKRAGAKLFLHKPIHLDALTALVKTHLH